MKRLKRCALMMILVLNMIIVTDHVVNIDSTFAVDEKSTVTNIQEKEETVKQVVDEDTYEDAKSEVEIRSVEKNFNDADETAQTTPKNTILVFGITLSFLILSIIFTSITSKRRN